MWILIRYPNCGLSKIHLLDYFVRLWQTTSYQSLGYGVSTDYDVVIYDSGTLFLFLTQDVIHYHNGGCVGYPDMMRDILEQARREAVTNRRKTLENLPIVDRLTGLYNREYFAMRLDEEMARSRLYGNRLSLILIDTGLSGRQDQGDENRASERAVKAIASIIGDCLTDTIGLAFHYNQGRFAVIVPEAGRHEAALTADHIRKTILREKMPGVKLHAGVVQYKDHESIDEFTQAADAALVRK
jgi:diguanylate cyclase (GGDEF)-like protein